MIDGREEEKVEPGVHYAYLGLAFLLYSVLAAWSLYHVKALTPVVSARGTELPAMSAPLFAMVNAVGWTLFAPLALLVVLEAIFPRHPLMTRIYLFSTLVLVLAGAYVGIALWLPARAFSG